MDQRVQCSMRGCYQRFDSQEAMRKHKVREKRREDAQDEIHAFYCEKCNEDCADDTEYMIHQLRSPRHIACPACGQEFRSTGGRNRHVGVTHRAKQAMQCHGCGQRFDSASAFMGHIEKNQCRVIKRDDFHKHKAEQEIERDAYGALEQAILHGETADIRDNALLDGGGVSLLANERFQLDADWPEPPISHEAVSEEPSVFDLTESISQLAVEYPALNADRKTSGLGLPARAPLQGVWSTHTPSEGLHRPSGLSRTSMSANQRDGGAWGNIKTTEQGGTSRNLLDDAGSINLLGSEIAASSSESAAIWGSKAGAKPGDVPQRSRPENRDPNAPFAQVQTAPQLRVTSRDKLQTYWDAIQGLYVCPGAGCRQKLKSPEEFERHLLTGVHASRLIQCPSCFKYFKTNTALVAHAESGSMRCHLRHAEDYDRVIQAITAGLVRVQGTWSGAGNARFQAVPIEEW